MRLQPGAFNRLLGNLGQNAHWRRAILCPCRDPYSGAASPSCPACHGRGVTWQPPQPVTLAMTNMRTAREWRDFGLWQSGDVVVTIPAESPLYTAGEHDQVILTDSSIPYSGIFTRGAPTEQWPPYLTDLEEVTVLAAGTPTTVPPPTPPPHETGGPPAWGSATLPAPGQQYSLRGRVRPRYFVFRDFPQDRAHQHGDDLPRRIVLRLFDLFGR